MGAIEILPPPAIKKPQSSKLLLSCLIMALTSSVALNGIFGGMILYSHGDSKGDDQLSLVRGWSKEAAEEAEIVAGIDCSGHGVAFLDGAPASDGEGPVCECYGCFTGPHCSTMATDGCVANVDSGNPLFLEPFWKKHAASSAVVISGWHRMSYTYDNGSWISLELEKLIRKLHRFVGNAITQDKFIVFGSGSTQLLNAAVHGLSSLMNSNKTASEASTVKVVASFPFYPVYQVQTDYFRSDQFEFQGEASIWKNNSDKFIEFVTSPNNPDCQLNKATLQGPSVKTINDHAYYWPHYTPIPSPANEDLMIFTLSKLTGHAGSRFGWALIKDEALYEKMNEYLRLNIVALSHETQLRALKLLKVALEKGEGREIFEFAYTKMRERWKRLNEVLSKTKRFSLQHIPPQFCSFSQQLREASPAYAWLRCNREEDTDCTTVLLSAGIIGRTGSIFGGKEGSRHVRLSLLKSQDDYELLITHIDNLVSLSSDQDGPKTM